MAKNNLERLENIWETPMNLYCDKRPAIKYST
uniref:Uncharacterized protein n=1 Tax=Rhizophora mucronata TaxID=61149 RepID=A0A2P2QDQ7_RHIMU